jgi:hypothetical protein
VEEQAALPSACFDRSDREQPQQLEPQRGNKGSVPMSRVKTYLLATLGFGLAGAIGAAFGTGTAQAVVASLVDVVNPTTSPVPTSPVNVTDPGRIAYQVQVDNTNKCSGQVCNFSFPAVPTGHRVVIQHVSAYVVYTSAPTVIDVSISNGTATFASNFFAPIPTGTPSGLFDQPTLMYVDSGLEAVVTLTLYGGSSPSFAASFVQVVTLTGYELDCTVAACAPIAAQ